jgi:competence protein ComEC
VKDPLIAPLLALSAGILAAHWARFEIRELGIAIFLLSGLTLLAVQRSRQIAHFGSLAVLLLCGALDGVVHLGGRAPELDAGFQETVLLSGCVVEPPAFYEGRDQFTVELARNARARVTLTVPNGAQPPDLRYGQRVEFQARVRRVRNLQNPGAFDYEGYAARGHIYWNASVSKDQPVAILPGRCGSKFLAGIFALRVAALNRIDRLYQGNAYATGIMEATLIGESSKLEKIWTDHFRRTGTYHMLVIDGLHITVLAAFLLFLLRICFVPELGALTAAACGAWLYALVSGFNAPAVRAAGGFTLYLICRYFYRRRRLLNLLAGVAIVYLFFDPGQLFEAGFQLSFLSVAAIAGLAIPLLEASSLPFSQALTGITETSRDPTMAPHAAQFRVELRLLAETIACYVRIPAAWLRLREKIGSQAKAPAPHVVQTLSSANPVLMPIISRVLPRALAFLARLVLYAYEMAVISTTIQIGLALPMALYFHRISLSGFSANVLVVPLLALVVPIGFAAIFTGWHFVAAIAEWLLIAGQKVADWHLRFEPAWRVPDPPFWLALAFSAALVGFAFTLRGTRRRANQRQADEGVGSGPGGPPHVARWVSGAVVVALFILLFWHPFPPRIFPRQLEVTAIDVGQGDSLLVAFPSGKLMLVDGGGILTFGQHAKPKLDIGEDVVSPYLWRRSIRKVDVVVLTHAHDDHAGGLPALIENFHPAELWTGATPPSTTWIQIERKARDQGVNISAMQSGRSFDFGGAHIDILSPPSDYVPGASPKNNDSLAMRITFGQRSFLLTGDMEKPMELRALAAGLLLHADVLKVGHHGSNTSSAEPFLDAVSPTFAMISDGFENSFHHPHPQVLERLGEHRADVLRTDLQGLITVRTDGRRMWVETYRPATRH